VDQDFSTLYVRNKEGKTPLLVAIDFACATVQSSCTDDGARVPNRGAHADQVAFDENTLAVVQQLVKRAPFSLDMGDAQDSTPLYTAAAHQGPGRVETINALIKGFDYINKNGLGQIPNLLQSSCRRYRIYDKMTALHIVCQPRHFSAALISKISKAEPTAVIIKNELNQTPLHLLCDPYQDSDTLERRRNALIPSDLNDIIVQMVQTTPQALKICDHVGRLPIHVYLESTFFTPKDPLVLSHMLKLYPESCWIESPIFGPISYIVTKDALLSENPNGLVPLCEVLDDEQITVVPDVMDPTLLCLWLVLNHCHSGSHASQVCLEANAMDCLQVMNIFVSQMSDPRLFLPRYEANVRCVGRLVVNAIFSAIYRKDLLSLVGVVPSEPTREDEIWPFQMVTEMQRKIDTCNIQSLKHEVINNIYRDNNTCSMMILCPVFDRTAILLIFPTMTPSMVAPSHKICPFYKPLAMFKFLTTKSLPCNLNVEAMGVISQWTPPQLILCRIGQLGPFAEEDDDTFPSDLFDLLALLKTRLDHFLREDCIEVC
jgi:hypothetical protein